MSRVMRRVKIQLNNNQEENQRKKEERLEAKRLEKIFQGHPAAADRLEQIFQGQMDGMDENERLKFIDALRVVIEEVGGLGKFLNFVDRRSNYGNENGKKNNTNAGNSNAGNSVNQISIKNNSNAGNKKRNGRMSLANRRRNTQKRIHELRNRNTRSRK
jgi:hypothetical protein